MIAKLRLLGRRCTVMSTTRRHHDVRRLILLTALSLLVFVTSCASNAPAALSPTAPAPAPSAPNVPATVAKPTSTPAVFSSLWSARPDTQGRYYAGNPSASLVVEEWSDFQ